MVPSSSTMRADQAGATPLYYSRKELAVPLASVGGVREGVDLGGILSPSPGFPHPGGGASFISIAIRGICAGATGDRTSVP